MRVVVTRPRYQGERTIERLAEMGHEALLLPLARPVHDVAAAVEALQKTEGAIAVTSAEAVRVLADAGPAWKPFIHRPLFAVGGATAEAAARIGFKVAETGGNGALLADMIRDQSAQLGQSPLLYLAGFPRATGFEARLKELGISFRTVECYRMEDVVPDGATLAHTFLDTPAEAILIYSRETARRLFELPFLRAHSDVFERTRFFCLSAAIAEAVPTSLQSRVKIAALPDEDSLLALLTED